MEIIRKLIRQHANIFIFGSFILTSYLFCFPLLRNLSLLGRGDWDYFFSLYEASYKTIIQYHQAPFWNPYFKGGMSLIGNPQQGFLSPIMAIVLVFGTVVGLKLAVWLHLFFALWGCWALAGYFGLTGLVRFVPAAIFVFSSHWALHLTEGHIIWLSAGFMPWTFLFFLKGIRGQKRFILATALCEAFMFYEGSTYTLIALVLFIGAYSFFLALQEKKWTFFVWFIGVHVLAAVVAAPKLFPVIEMISQYHHVVGPGKLVPVMKFASFFSDQFQTLHRESVLGAGYWEFGAYIGMIAGLIYFYSFSLFRTQPALVWSALFMLLVCVGNFSFLSPWSILHKLPIINTFHLPMRLVQGLLLPLGLLVGIFLERMKSKLRLSVIVVTIILVVDLFLVGTRIFQEAPRPWTIQGRDSILRDSFFSQEFVPVRKQFAFGAWSDQFIFVYYNKGVVDAYEPVPIKGRAIPRGSKNYRGEFYLLKGSGQVQQTYWSPNKLSYRSISSEEDVLVINQNFDPGWHSSLGKAFSYQGLIAVRVPPGEHVFVLGYLPASFLIGVAVLGVGILFIGLMHFVFVRATVWAK